MIKQNEKSIKNKTTEQKITLYETALTLDNNDINAIKGLAFCYKDLGKIDLAAKYFSMAKRIKPFDRNLYFELGQLEILQKNYIKAIRLFMNAIKLSPDYTEAIIAMAEAHEAISELDMAEMIYLKIFEKKPEMISIYEKLGYLYIKTNNLKKALNCFRELLAIDKNYTEAYFGLATCFDKNGQSVEAKRYYKKYLFQTSSSDKKTVATSRLRALSAPKRTHSVDKSYLKVI